MLGLRLRIQSGKIDATLKINQSKKILGSKINIFDIR